MNNGEEVLEYDDGPLPREESDQPPSPQRSAANEKLFPGYPNQPRLRSRKFRYYGLCVVPGCGRRGDGRYPLQRGTKRGYFCEDDGKAVAKKDEKRKVIAPVVKST